MERWNEVDLFKLENTNSAFYCPKVFCNLSNLLRILLGYFESLLQESIFGIAIRCLRDDTVSALSLQSRPLRSHRVKCAIILVNSEQLAVIKHRKPSQVADNDTPDVPSKSSAPANDFDIAVCVGDSCLRIGGKPSSFELGNGGWKGEKGEKVHAYGTYRVYGMTVELYKDEKLMPWWAAERQARIGFCPNPQSLRALMTARHDPPGKILAIMEHATSNMQLKVSRIYGYVARPKERERVEIRRPWKTSVYGTRFIKRNPLRPKTPELKPILETYSMRPWDRPTSPLVSFREKDRGQSVCTCTILPQQVPLCLFRGNIRIIHTFLTIAVLDVTLRTSIRKCDRR
ncbi:hypothetical protein V1478_017885 [Vespula squamosa]|uniref:Uncharacterized protein n=1 Tax=Vespula squamosa TaxID=30214 RepID=A0ABD1ZVZ4_VESSQ